MLIGIMKLMRKYLFEITGAAMGALAGFLYWKYVGCISGTCPIQTNPYISTVYGVLLGVLLGGLLKDIVRKIKEKTGV